MSPPASLGSLPTPPVRKLLANLPIFGALSEAAIDQVARLLKIHHYDTGVFVVSEGDTDKNVFIVERGEVEVLKSCPGLLNTPARIARLGPGACFGEMALIDVMPRSASVRTIKPTVLLSFSNADLFYIYQWHLESFTLIMMNLARELSRRLRIADVLLAERALPRAEVW